MKKIHSNLISAACYLLGFGCYFVLMFCVVNKTPAAQRSLWPYEILSHSLPIFMYASHRLSKLCINKFGVSLSRENITVFERQSASKIVGQRPQILDTQLLTPPKADLMSQRERIQYYVLALSVFLGMGCLTGLNLLNDIQQRQVSRDSLIFGFFCALSLWGIITLTNYQRPTTLAKFNKTISVLTIRRAQFSTIRIPWTLVHFCRVVTYHDEWGIAERHIDFCDKEGVLIKKMAQGVLSDENYEAVVHFVQNHLQHPQIEYSMDAFTSASSR